MRHFDAFNASPRWCNAKGVPSRVARNSQRRAFLKFDSTVNEVDPNFDVFSVGLRQIQSVFSSKNRWSQKKRFSPKFRAFFRPKSSDLLLISRCLGGLFSYGEAISRFIGKINLKTAKNIYFAYFSGQWGGYSSICPPPPSKLRYWACLCRISRSGSICIERTWQVSWLG